MCEREPRPGCVYVNVQLPRHLADLLAERRGDFIAIIELLGRECQYLPPSVEVQAEADRLNEKKRQERQDRNTRFGRAGYRIYRRRIKTDGYQKADGDYRDRPAKFSQVQWRRIVIADIAEELGVQSSFMEFVLPRFHQELLAKIKPRRDKAITRLYRQGFRNQQIAERVSVSIATIDRFLRAHRKAQTGESN